MSDTVEHEFGGQHTDIKLEIVEKYLKRYSAALHTWCDQVWYIDAFAGTGRRTVRVKAREGDLFEEPVPEQVEHRRGSAKIAIDIEPPFDRLVFMDVKPKHVAALEALKAEHPSRDIDVLEGDANKLIKSEIAWEGWRKTRAVMFLDPYGMEVEWDTLRRIAETKAIDVWYLFPLSGLYRQAARDLAKIDGAKERAITRMLGTDEWKQELYSDAPRPAANLLFDMEPVDVRQRNADVAGLEQYVKKRLKTIFAEVLDPFPLPSIERPQKFSLFCAISNPSKRAISLAQSFGGSIVKSMPASHHRTGR
ncbi:MAG: three-Cys-motif partner protein TcmP [Mesorhizobium sp.]|nr:MAG: three-Cys-motif partner protein TcmP [Mesorhizobium sp.]RWD83382.1 MAG: three-Cys-motif partner protein TcmP [Mesorhizobium sp.]TJW65658.1 MAG: three-Cys-motif partner protein TcmP [Mesorhizobium sp.]